MKISRLSLPRGADPREVRVFLSSTFKDMQAERAHLVTNVFPELRAFCRERGVVFTEIDLRWGISDDLANTGFTVDICLSEIERCSAFPPFFIGFLAERYGWVPEEGELERFKISHAGDAEGRAAMIDQARRDRISVTELEMRYAFETYPHATTHSRVFLRADALTDAIAAEPGPPAPYFRDGNQDKLDALKQTLRDAQLVGVDGYTSIDAFGDAVREFLRTTIERLYPLDEAPSARERQRRDQAAFADTLRVAYARNEAIDGRILGLVADLPGRAGAAFVHVRGAEGMGKSALIAHLDAQLGATAGDSALVLSAYFELKGYPTLDAWAAQMLDDLDPGAASVHQDGDTRLKHLAQRLVDAARDGARSVVILLDGLDHARDGSGDLARLRKVFAASPRTLIVVTSSQLPPRDWEPLELMPFGPEDIRRASTLFLECFRKELDDSVLDQLATCKPCGNPLFLRMLLEELRMHGDRARMREQIAGLAACREPGRLFRQILASMREDLDDAAHPWLAVRAARLMGASWRGLKRHDLAVLLARRVPEGAMPVDPPREPGGLPCLPERFLSPVMARLDPYVLNGDGYFDLLTHASLIESCQGVDPAKPRLRLLEYVEPLAADDPWAAAETVYQLAQLAGIDPDGIPDAQQRMLALLGPLHSCAQVIAQHRLVFEWAIAALVQLAARSAGGIEALAQQWLAHWREDLGDAPGPERLTELATVLQELRLRAAEWAYFGDDYPVWDTTASHGGIHRLLEALLSGGLREVADKALHAAIATRAPDQAHVDATLTLLDATERPPLGLDWFEEQPLRWARIQAWMLHRACPSGSHREAQALLDLATAPRIPELLTEFDVDTDVDTDWLAEQRRVDRIAARWARRALLILDRIGERSALTEQVLRKLVRLDPDITAAIGLDRIALRERLVELNYELGHSTAAIDESESLAAVLMQRGESDAAARVLARARAEGARLLAYDPGDATLLRLQCGALRRARAAGDTASLLDHARAVCTSFASTATTAAQQRRDNGAKRLSSLSGGDLAEIGSALAALVAAEPSQADTWLDRVVKPLRAYLAPRIDVSGDAILAIREES